MPKPTCSQTPRKGSHFRLQSHLEASTEQLQLAENGERHVLQMLLAYVNRTIADQVLVQDVRNSN